MADTLLIGMSTGGTYNMGGPKMFLSPFVATKSGTLKALRVVLWRNDPIMVAVYADSAGAPGALLTASASVTPGASGWATIDVPDIIITAGTTYWLAFANGDACGSGTIVEGGVTWYKAITYSGFAFPDPAGSGYNDTIYAGYLVSMGGWGEESAGGRRWCEMILDF